MKKTIIDIVFFTLVFALISCGTSVTEYEPKNQAEKELKALLIEFQDYRNKHDLDGWLSLFRSDAKVMQGYGPGRKYVTKQQARETEPETFRSYPTVKYANPEMKVTGNQALIRFDGTTQGLKHKETLQLVKENDRWLIIKFAYSNPFD